MERRRPTGKLAASTWVTLGVLLFMATWKKGSILPVGSAFQHDLRTVSGRISQSANDAAPFQLFASLLERESPRRTTQVDARKEDITVQSSAATNRRLFMASSLIAAGGWLSGGEAVDAAMDAAPSVSASSNRPASSLPWVKDPINPKRSRIRVEDAEASGIYNVAFVTYLARFLLNFDPYAQQWWIDGAKEIYKKQASSQSAIFAIRSEQFSKFAASVELGLLQEFNGPDGPKRLLESLLKRFCSIDAKMAENIGGATTDSGLSTAKQQRLIRETKEARRQIALLFGLLSGNSQPTQEITKLLASVDNGSLSTIVMLEDDPFSPLLRGFAPDEIPAIDLAPPQASLEDGFTQATARPIMTPTGEILRLDIMQPTSGESTDAGIAYKRPPKVTISPPAAPEGRRAQAIAKLQNGLLRSIQLTDPGRGYTLEDNIHVQVEPSDGSAIERLQEPRSPKVTAVLEMAVSRVEVVDPGNGYAVEKPIRVQLIPPKGGKGEVIGLGYAQGERASFTAYRISGDNTVRAFEQALADKATSGGVSGTSSGGSLPPSPFSSKASSSQQLLSLLPEGFGLEYDESAKRYVLSVDNELVSPSTGASRLVPDFGPRGESPIERDMKLDLPTFLRFCISGAICSSGVHLVLTPLDVVKTKVQTNPDKYPKISTSFATIWKDEGLGTFFTGWFPTLSGNFAAGSVLYAMTELIRRTLAESAGTNADSLEVVIILASAAISSALAATVLCPFETVRIRSVAQPDYGSNTFAVVKRIIREEGITSIVNTIPVFLVKVIDSCS